MGFSGGESLLGKEGHFQAKGGFLGGVITFRRGVFRLGIYGVGDSGGFQINKIRVSRVKIPRLKIVWEPGSLVFMVRDFTRAKDRT